MANSRTTVRQRVHAEVRRRIVTLELAPRTPISENELAAELGVSRTPVRESLLLLREEGLVDVFPQMGTFVSPIDTERARVAQFIREAIECSALQGLDRASATEVFDLHTNLVEQRESARMGNDARFFALDELFHEGLLRLTGREQAWPVVQGSKVHLDRARRVGYSMHSTLRFVDQHDEILARVEAGDVADAVAHLREHLRVILSDLDVIEREMPELLDVRPRKPVRRMVTTLEPA